MTNHLLPATRNSDGHISSQPVIVEVNDEGKVCSWYPLGPCEPHSTTPLRALLDLTTLELLPL